LVEDFLPLSKYLIKEGNDMPNSTYKIIELIGTSDKSWEEAARTAIETAGKTLQELRVAEVTKLDVTVENGTIKNYRARLNVSFKVVS
jgi:flavin-binding protein dodecin